MEKLCNSTMQFFLRSEKKKKKTSQNSLSSKSYFFLFFRACHLELIVAASFDISQTIETKKEPKKQLDLYFFFTLDIL